MSKRRPRVFRSRVVRGAMLLAVLYAVPVRAEIEFLAEVVRVKDGDSVILLSGGTRYEARLADIDAPEYDQAWGQQSRKALSRLVKGKRVSARVMDIDSYGRLVVMLELDGTSVNRSMVEAGHAWVYRDYLRETEFLEVEARARAAHRGLWGKADPIAPWRYRHGERQPAPPPSGSSMDLWDKLRRPSQVR